MAIAGYAVVLFYNLSNGKRPGALDRLEVITGKRFPFIEDDLRDTAKLQETLETYHIDAAIHFASLKTVGETVEKPVKYYANNMVGAVKLL